MSEKQQPSDPDNPHDTRLLKRNIYLFYAYQAFATPGWLIPIVVIFFTQWHGMSNFEALLILALYSLYVGISEVPTGVVADKYSRKISIIIGSLLLIVGTMGQYFASSFWLVNIATFLMGVGQSFRSGADQALIYDSLKDLKATKSYGKIIARTTTLQLAVTSLTIYIGGHLGTWDFFTQHSKFFDINPYFVLFALSSLWYLISAIIVAFMKEPHTSKKARDLMHSNYLTHLKESYRYVVSRESIRNALMYLILFGGIFRALAQSLGWVVQPVLLDLGYTSEGIGTIATLVMISFGVGYFLYPLLEKRLETYKILFFSMVASTGLLVLWTTAYTRYVTIFVAVFIGGLVSMMTVALNHMINDRTDSGKRSTVLSFASLVARAYSVILLGVAGLSADKISTRGSLVWVAFVSVVAMGALQYGLWESRRLEEGKSSVFGG